MVNNRETLVIIFGNGNDNLHQLTLNVLSCISYIREKNTYWEWEKKILAESESKYKN